LGAKVERQRREPSRAPRWVRCGEGVSPSPPAERSGEGEVPPPEFFFEILGSYGVFSSTVGGLGAKCRFFL